MENICTAHANAKRGKMHYQEVQDVEEKRDTYLQQLQTQLVTKTFKTSEYYTFTKTDSGKPRKIYKLPYFPDRIVHHCIMQVLEPIWKKTFIADTYSSIKDRGIHKGVKRIKSALVDIENTQYCLKLDIHKFYPSINHNILKTIIRRKIKDPDVLFILDEIIDSAEGVPIGNYLSQYFGNLYLTYFDHWLKETKHCKFYFRYCDDMVTLHADKVYLSQLKEEIEAYLSTNLKLALKSNWQIFPVDARGIDFLGYRFFHDYILLRKSIAIKFKQRIKYIETRWRDLPPSGILNSVMSYRGWLGHADCYNLAKKYINQDLYAIFNNVCKKEELSNPLRGKKRE
jgi:retron-type reverse transcriptase